MQNRYLKLTTKLLSKAALPLTFFMLYFFSLYLLVKPAFIYHGGYTITNFPAFFTTPYFLYQHLARPGGPAQYIYAFIAQFLSFNALGALIITVQAWMIFAAMQYMSKKLNIAVLRPLSYLPALIILFLYNHYTFHFAAFNTIAIQLILFCLYLNLPKKTKPFVLIPASPLIYYITGAPLLYLLLLCIIHELLNKNYLYAVLYAAVASITPYLIGVLLFDITFTDSYSDMLAFSWKITTFTDRARFLNLVYILYALPAVITVVAELLCAMKKDSPKMKTPESFYKTAALAVTLVVMLAAVSLSYDKKQKAFFAVDYYSYHKNWPKVLHYAEQLPNNFFAVHHATRALYHTARLNEEMFKYTQHPNALLFTDNDILRTGLTTFDLYLDLGIINLAEHYLARSIGYLGERDILLKRLAWVNMIKGNTETAKTILNALSKTLFMKDWATEQLNQIGNDPSLANNNKIQSARKNLLTQNYSMTDVLPDKFLKDLLVSNPENKMAFDYLMAWYIITKNTEEFTNNLNRLHDFGHEELPVVYQHAILMHIYNTNKDVNMHGFQISDETVEYAKQFFLTMYQHTGKELFGLEVLNEKYGDTYLYYFVRRFSRMPEFIGRPK